MGVPAFVFHVTIRGIGRTKFLYMVSKQFLYAILMLGISPCTITIRMRNPSIFYSAGHREDVAGHPSANVHPPPTPRPTAGRLRLLGLGGLGAGLWGRTPGVGSSALGASGGGVLGGVLARLGLA